MCMWRFSIILLIFLAYGYSGNFHNVHGQFACCFHYIYNESWSDINFIHEWLIGHFLSIWINPIHPEIVTKVGISDSFSNKSQNQIYAEVK